MARPRRMISVGRLIGTHVLDSAGRRLGRVIDIRMTALPSAEVVALIIGPWALPARLGVDGAIVRQLTRGRRLHLVPWAVVDRVEGESVHLEAGGERRIHEVDAEDLVRAENG